MLVRQSAKDLSVCRRAPLGKDESEHFGTFGTQCLLDRMSSEDNDFGFAAVSVTSGHGSSMSDPTGLFTPDASQRVPVCGSDSPDETQTCVESLRIHPQAYDVIQDGRKGFVCLERTLEDLCQIPAEFAKRLTS